MDVLQAWRATYTTVLEALLVPVAMYQIFWVYRKPRQQPRR
jgi:hypothetical protein